MAVLRGCLEKNGVNTPVSEIVLISLFLLHVKFSTARKIGKDDGGTELKLGCWCGGGEVIILADITPIQFGWVSPRFLNLDQQSGAAGSQSRTVIPLLALDFAPELSV